MTEPPKKPPKNQKKKTPQKQNQKPNEQKTKKNPPTSELITGQKYILKEKRLVANGPFSLAQRSTARARTSGTKSQVIQSLIVARDRISFWND